MSIVTPETRIFVAGHRGMVGSAICRRLKADGYPHVVTRSHRELDLTDQQAVATFFRANPVDYVVLAAAKVGGIQANNTYRGEFIYQNLMIEANVIHQAHLAGVRRLLFLGSSCIYPRQAPQPIREEYLLTGKLEPTNSPYAVAKLAGIEMCAAYNNQYDTRYRAVMPTNLYGPNDNYDLENSHVLPALIRKFHLAKMAAADRWEAVAADERVYGPIPEEIMTALKAARGGSVTAADHAPAGVRLWGSGAPRREFLHVDDLADACLFVMGLPDALYNAVLSGEGGAGLSEPDEGPPVVAHINAGTGQDVTIRELARLVKKIVGYRGSVDWDSSRPDGTLRKRLDVTRLERAGWRPAIGLEDGIRQTYRFYLAGLER